MYPDCSIVNYIEILLLKNPDIPCVQKAYNNGRSLIGAPELVPKHSYAPCAAVQSSCRGGGRENFPKLEITPNFHLLGKYMKMKLVLR